MAEARLDSPVKGAGGNSRTGRVTVHGNKIMFEPGTYYVVMDAAANEMDTSLFVSSVRCV